MYPEYDPNEQSLGQSFADILRGFKNKQNLQQVGQGIVNTAKLVPNVAESLVRGGVAQAVGTMGDLRDLRNTVQSYLPQSVQNFSNAAEFLTNPYAKALIQTAPTTEQTLDFVPRATAPYEGYKQHETLGEYIAPSLGYFGAKALKATKDLPIGMTIQDVTPPIEPTKVAEALRQPEKNALGFYSPLEEAVSNLQNAKGTGQQYLAQLLKTQGVKQEEVATRGLDTFLESNPKVTKTQIEEYLGKNPVNLQETVLGQRESYDPKRLTQLENEWSNLKEHAIDDPSFGEPKYDEMIKLQNIRDNSTVESLYRDHDLYVKRAQIQQKQGNKAEADKFFRQAELLNTRAEKLDLEGLGPTTPTKFGAEQFNIPNGENYREVLIQLPSERMDIMDAAKEHYKTFIQKGGEPNFDRLPYEKQMEIVNTMPNEAKNVSSKGEFVNMSHFEQPNILAHMRVDDRVIDGKKTLFIQEIQSDWHQKGRKEGYQTKVNTKDLIRELTPEDKQRFGVDKGVLAKVKDTWGYYPSKKEAEEYLQLTLSKNGVPDAPFKKNWQELAMKRAMQMAAEGGYDRVAFTTGNQQSARYDLSKQINTLRAEKITSGPKTGQYEINATDKNGKPSIYSVVTESELENTIGKDLAKKIVEDAPNNPDGKEYSGLDLKVGGEGMKGFYDKILPDFINKYGKKHNIKVSKTNLESSGTKDVLAAEVYGKGETYANLPSEQKRKIDAMYVAQGNEVHYFDLTPEAKESFLKKGQPMFAAAPAISFTDEDTRRETLEKLFNSKK